MKNVPLLVTLSGLCVSCSNFGSASGSPKFDSAISICNVVKTAREYDNQTIELRAVYKLTTHGPVLAGNENCPNAFVVWRKVNGYSEASGASTALDLVTQSDGKIAADVVLRGRFHVIVGGFECSATTYCSNLIFDASELVAAKVRN
jgi:hypothetical protein